MIRRAGYCSQVFVRSLFVVWTATDGIDCCERRNTFSAPIAIEACGASHHWARLLRSFGHEVKLIAPQLVKYVKRGKNDAG